MVDVTEWASASKGFIWGFTCPVALTNALWARLGKQEDECDGTERAASAEDTRRRTHDVLWTAAVALRGSLARNDSLEVFVVLVGRRKLDLWAVVDGDGVTIGFPADF